MEAWMGGRVVGAPARTWAVVESRTRGCWWQPEGAGQLEREQVS